MCVLVAQLYQLKTYLPEAHPGLRNPTGKLAIKKEREPSATSTKPFLTIIKTHFHSKTAPNHRIKLKRATNNNLGSRVITLLRALPQHIISSSLIQISLARARTQRENEVVPDSMRTRHKDYQ